MLSQFWGQVYINDLDFVDMVDVLFLLFFLWQMRLWYLCLGFQCKGIPKIEV